MKQSLDPQAEAIATDAAKIFIAHKVTTVTNLESLNALANRGTQEQTKKARFNRLNDFRK